ncbi:50S ribosomal protein L13 [Mageeibacillus indolicus]|jgi:hypothetical protein|uniref:Large ribosomal subunit protein uL13 n=2 Tax=Mageeibacillus indolicus TaxID=884684 RepID=D3R2A1_MAGIU|nr:50S ribosomal protein L13 [Mageeibacillus indolicus]ADC90891.1 ribosomal protein L13 [Mageeibacillus indolicus UPII9-5]KFA57846.1 50S ribosomal protein L13 [Mageeibacillus indolicus 0009-5]PNH19795.1 50S ribosomal protein L13 [Mageeibacillus indolicus]
MSTFVATPANVTKKWYLVDAKGKTLGRLASEIAKILSGKNKPEYSPAMDTGDYVVVINAGEIKFTGKKLNHKLYRYHTGFPGGLKEVQYSELMAKKPTKALELAVKGMLPKNSLGRQMFKKLHLYAGAEHDQTAQKPEVLDIKA